MFSAAALFAALPCNLQRCLFPFPDLRPKRSEGRDGIDVDKFVNLPHRCFGGVICPPSHVRLEQFCLHGIEHSLDVARIGYIKNLEQGLSFRQDVIYAMALLHDIGRCEEYASGKSHHEAGAELARPILLACGYTEHECAEICDAIGRHKAPSEQARSLATLLYDADKQSRNCFDCPVQEQCYWSEEKKNHTIRY